ncbi:hypothetical protein [Dyella japonica]|uniref:hypothetical protein n=1 Tax=Dyella japonica TaxID=231455 RepID=UPI000A97E999|nr:hypothetical protein [Dyella japonica]
MTDYFLQKSVSLGDELADLLGNSWHSPRQLGWPPDVFAVCAYLLEVSGAYINIMKAWPPNGDPGAWEEFIEKNASAWRRSANATLAAYTDETPSPPQVTPAAQSNIPREVKKLWRIVWSSRNVPVEQISLAENSKLCGALLTLIALADAACVGFGLPLDRDDPELDFSFEVQKLLITHGTFTPRLPRTRLCTLPKQHTPRLGITMRSLTHHLALFTGGEVAPTWSVQGLEREPRFNLLVVPWPPEIFPTQFSEAPVNYVHFGDPFKCFNYEVKAADDLLSRTSDHQGFEGYLQQIFLEAKMICGDIQGIVFPEAALTPGDFQTVERVSRNHGCSCVVAGVSGRDGQEPFNQVWMAFGLDEDRSDRVVKQGKHHRWQLNRSQIEMYGLGGSLDPKFKWWEHTGIEGRSVNFVAIHDELTICCLICEDLARQDPVAQLVRSVGPNLVIALLSDGPQIAQRWPARYATVLADDPGSSVLTVTSLGMTQLATPPPGSSRSRVVALWKDAENGLKEITLNPNAVAVVLNLWNYSETEYTADGRSDGGVSTYPSLGGCHQIFL